METEVLVAMAVVQFFMCLLSGIALAVVFAVDDASLQMVTDGLAVEPAWALGGRVANCPGTDWRSVWRRGGGRSLGQVRVCNDLLKVTVLRQKTGDASLGIGTFHAQLINPAMELKNDRGERAPLRRCMDKFGSLTRLTPSSDTPGGS